MAETRASDKASFHTGPVGRRGQGLGACLPGVVDAATLWNFKVGGRPGPGQRSREEERRGAGCSGGAGMGRLVHGWGVEHSCGEGARLRGPPCSLRPEGVEVC